tara:strand:- start:4662 stop:6023 length:1362 start_codon:yes stop_codon:yes gene_type:complete
MLKIKFFIYFLISTVFSSEQTVFIIPINGDIDMGLPYVVNRGIDQAENDDAKLIIFDIDTFGGRVDAATKIKDSILGTKIPTVAFINRRAISAGALISLSCDSIYMTSGATIGAATAVDLQGNKGSEKVISYMREEMASTAEANGKSREIAAMMVDESLELDFYVTSFGDTLNSTDIEGFKVDKLVTLTTKDALKLGFANETFENIESLIDYLGFDNSQTKKITSTWSEELVRFLTNPTVAPLLMSLGFLGLLFEVKSPGLGFPGIAGIIFLTLFFGSHFLVGLADIIEIILLFFGILLVILEILIIPGFGIAGITGGGLILWSIFYMLLGEYPSAQDYSDAYFGLSIATIGAIAAGILLFKIITESKYYSQIIEFKPQRKQDGYSISKGFEKFVGKSGISTTDLRPSGKINIDNQIFQAISTGDYINKNSKIIVLRIDENQMVVAMKDNKTT